MNTNTRNPAKPSGFVRPMVQYGVPAVGLLALSTLSQAQIDHCTPAANLVSSSGFGVIQQFQGLQNYNATVIDDFNFSGPTTVTNMRVAFETSAGVDVHNIKSWQLSIWGSPGAAATSGPGLAGDVVSLPTQTAVYTSILGSGASGPAYYADFAVNVPLAAGTYWIGMAADMPYAFGQIFILNNTNPGYLGNGTNFDSIGVNPGNGFGNNPSFPVGTNAAYALTAVPEPASIACCLGLVATMIKRRKGR